MLYVNRICLEETFMNARTLRPLLASLLVAALAACGGSGEPLLAAAAPAPQALPAPAAAPMPVASACTEPSCLGGADGLADQFRTASMERAGQAGDSSQPAYPNVPAHAMVVAEARIPEMLGSATLQRAQ